MTYARQRAYSAPRIRPRRTATASAAGLERRREGRTAQRWDTAAPGAPCWTLQALDDRVLIVVRNAQFGATIERALDVEGVPATWIDDGETALMLLATSLPAAIVIDLDLDVGGVSGHRLFQLLGRDPQTASVPIVVLSEGPVCGRRFASLRPPEGFLQHPVSVDEVLSEVRCMLRSREVIDGHSVLRQLGGVGATLRYRLG